MQPPTAPASDSALRLAVDLRTLPSLRRLAVDYAFDFDRLALFFAGNPADASAWPEAIARVQRHARPRSVAAMVGAQLERRGSPLQARTAAAQLADPSCVAIVTGQQAGLFGGPLFTMLKALTTLRLARRVSHEHGVPVVPVFWIDAEDHDWPEVAGCGVLATDEEWRRIEVPPPPGAGEQTIASLRFTDAITGALAELGETLPRTEFTPALLEALAGAYAPGRGAADAFARWLDHVLGPHGLIVYDASDPAAKPMAAAVFRRELEQPGQTARLAAEAGAALASRGYHMQVTPNESSVALFAIDQGRRRPIRVANGAFAIGDERVDRESLLARAADRPDAFSPNVLLRPIVQDTIFPTLCYVSGPNELGYLAQLGGVYQHFGVPMPLVQPRATATVLDSAAVRFLTKYKVALPSLEAQDDSTLNELLRAQLPPAVERSMHEAEAEIANRMEAVIGAVPQIDPTLEGAARNTLGKLQHDLRALGGKIVQAAKRRDETLRRQFQHVRRQAYPGGAPQERAVGFVTFLNRYGPAFVDRLAAELPVDGRTHWVLTI